MPTAVAIRFDVTDTGIGITAEQQKRLFQPFSQGDASVTRAFGGTGLGLAISRRLAQFLGGDIVLQTESGKGSTFRLPLMLVTLPACDTSGHRHQLNEKARVKPQTTHCLVMCWSWMIVATFDFFRVGC
jgi:signal transduction histidine kinase